MPSRCSLCPPVPPPNPPPLTSELLGPFRAGTGPLEACWVHRECAEWAPEVYWSEAGELCKVGSALRRGRQMVCAHCGSAGATLGCYVAACPLSYHYACAAAGGATVRPLSSHLPAKATHSLLSRHAAGQQALPGSMPRSRRLASLPLPGGAGAAAHARRLARTGAPAGGAQRLWRGGRGALLTRGAAAEPAGTPGRARDGCGPRGGRRPVCPGRAALSLFLAAREAVLGDRRPRHVGRRRGGRAVAGGRAASHAASREVARSRCSTGCAAATPAPTPRRMRCGGGRSRAAVPGADSTPHGRRPRGSRLHRRPLCSVRGRRRGAC